MTEQQHAEAFARWLTLNSYRFTHIANESGLPPKVAMIAAIKKKRMGVSPWFPDFLIVLKRWSLLFIEMKKEKGKKWGMNGSRIAPEQTEWIEALDVLNNVRAVFAHGWEEAVRIVQESENL